MLRRKRKAEKYSALLIPMAEKLVHGYYERLLSEELREYAAILDRHLLSSSPSQDQAVLQMLFSMSHKLAASSLPRDIMGFFVYTATERGFPPSDFLAAAEISRLDFSPQFGCIINVTEEQVRMVMALGVGIKIFCFYLLYKPWDLECASDRVRQERQALATIVKNVASIFYYLLFEDFCLSLKEIHAVNKSLIVNLGVRPIRQLDPLNEG
jgi:hypothetical protein